MEIKLKDFIKKGEIIAFVHFSGSFRKFKNNKNISYVLDESMHQNMLVENYFKKLCLNYESSRFLNACKMVLLESDILKKNIKNLSRTEIKKLRFVEALLNQSETIVFENFFSGFYGKDINYFRKLLIKMTKYGKCIIFVTNNVEDLFGLVKRFILFQENNYEWILDFYDAKIYQYVSMPKIISYVNFLNENGKNMEHYIETKEVLKAIYRSVESRGKI